ncbi:MAG: ChrR family anti-sigma-E factor [Roseovarius sp.]
MTKDMIKHHLTDALLMAYSAGTLPEAFSLTVAAHISMCDECRARLGAYDTVGGSLMEAEDAAELATGSLDSTLRLIELSETRPTEPGIDPHREEGVLPVPVRAYVGGDLGSVRWRSVGMGVKQAILPTASDATARLLYIPAGAAVPDHGHRGTELTLVLKGAFEDKVDHFGPGDIEVADEDLDHTPIADIGEDCICLAATDAPLRFNSWLPRIAQPFLRI